MKARLVSFDAPQGASSAPPPAVPPIRRACLAHLYEEILQAFADSFWDEHPELARQHRFPLQDHLRQALPKRAFLDRHLRWARRHPEVDPIPRATGDAVETISHAIDIYVRRHVETDFTAPFLDGARSFEEACHIAWIDHELDLSAFAALTGQSFSFAREDRVFAFCSPVYSWQQGFGRQGLVVVRAAAVVASVVTEAS